MLTVQFGRKAQVPTVPEATTASVLALHIEQCKTDKARIEATLKAQDQDRRQMHVENQARFRRLEVVYYFATAIIALIVFFGTDLGQRVLSVTLHGATR